mgnify:CR=1 FL=1
MSYLLNNKNQKIAYKKTKGNKQGIVFIHGYGSDMEGEKARPKYPTANAILKKYEEVVPIANYSILVKDSVIHRHTGPENRRGHHLRVHIPLHIPKGDIFLEVNGEEVDWSDCFGFNNQYTHQYFKNSFPQQYSEYNLNNWEKYEQENFNTFLGMYNFFLIK